MNTNQIIGNFEVQLGYIVGKTWKIDNRKYFNSSLPFSILSAKRETFAERDSEYMFIIDVVDLTTGESVEFENVIDAEYVAARKFIEITGD